MIEDTFVATIAVDEEPSLPNREGGHHGHGMVLPKSQQQTERKKVQNRISEKGVPGLSGILAVRPSSEDFQGLSDEPSIYAMRMPHRNSINDRNEAIWDASIEARFSIRYPTLVGPGHSIRQCDTSSQFVRISGFQLRKYGATASLELFPRRRVPSANLG